MTESTEQSTVERWKTLGAVVGENVRRLREERALTQHELAQIWKRQGLSWARSKVAALESGNRPRVDCGELVMMAAGLGVAVTELFQGGGDVHLAPHPRVVRRESLRSALNGGPIDIFDDGRLLPGPERDAALEQIFRVIAETPSYPPWEADHELARRLGRPTDEVVKAATSIFDGRTLTEERDRRVSNLGQMPMSERMAHRGHVTRELATLVEEHLSTEAGAQ
jgi:transcriptional regulator with XRE-family HTH domain